MILRVLLSFFLLLGMPGCQESKEVRIGFIAQLSGPNAFIGQTAKLALDDRIREINHQGGIRGYKIRLITYDSRYEVLKAVTNARRLAERDHVIGIIGPEWSGAAIQVAKIADSLQVPTVATSATNDQVTVDAETGLHPYMFRVCFIDSYQGYALADFAFKKLNQRKAAFVTDVTSAYSVGMQNIFDRQFENLGGKIVLKEGYRAGNTDFSTQINAVSQSGADIVIIPAATNRDPVNFARQAHASALSFNYLGVDGWVADDLLADAGEELEGAYLSSGLSTDQVEFQEYNHQFMKTHKANPSIYSYYALDALYTLEYAIGVSIDQSGQPDRQAVRTAIEQMKEVPVFTRSMTMDPSTHNPLDLPILILKVRNSQFQIITSYQP